MKYGLYGTLILAAMQLCGCGASAEHDHSVGAEPTVSAAAETQSTAAPVAVLPDRPAPVALTELIAVPQGNHRPMYPGKNEPEVVIVPAFQLEATPVTNAQFLAFVWDQPKWRRGQVKSLFADANYLIHWPSELELPESMLQAPVTNISWFAARAYAKWAGRRLPMLAEWEYVAAASETAKFGRDDPDYNQRILTWYSRPTPIVPSPVGGDPANIYGVYDMHGLIWEWVDDFNTALVTGESRGDSGLDRNLFCGSESVGSADPKDYAAFMRFAFRSSLEAKYTVRNLGFRCATNLEQL
ncbi:MAG: formylglycine-generating enzyme family protein [Planctomycetota bacterium]|nr:formylglycine-generating enzyme family protein [Planctomycetota bacterium]